MHTGAAIGELIDGEDGDQLLVGFDGRILRGVDADGQEIDQDQLLAEYGTHAYRVERVEWIAGRLEGKSVSTADELAQE